MTSPPRTPDTTAANHLRSLRQEVMQHCPHVNATVLEAFFTQLDTDYFHLFPARQIAAHVQLIAAVDDQQPVQMHVRAHSATSAEVCLAAYDLFGEFSLITGLMAAYGLNIVEGQVFSYQRGPGRMAPWGHMASGMIVDIFTVQYDAEHAFDTAVQTQFVTQLTALLQLLRQSKWQQAREVLNYRLIDAMRTSQQTFSARLFPVDIRIDNARSPDWTIVEITADDTPAFLYSLSNALAMRNVYIHRVTIRSEQGKVHDQLYVGRHRGGKITSEAGQRELHLIVTLIKQFTLFLTVAPDPVKALRHFDQLLDRLANQNAPNEDIHWLGEEGPLKALATVLGSSDFLWEDFLRMQHTSLLPLLKDMGEVHHRVDKAILAGRLQDMLQTAVTAADRKTVLNTYKDRELFRIDMRHLLHPELPFGSFSDELSDLAEVVVVTAFALATQTLQERYGVPQQRDGSLCTFAIFGLGKFGGRELGYASDIEMLCVYSGPGNTSGGREQIAVSEYGEFLVQQFRDSIVARRSGIFEIDLRLRPFGSHGALATSLDTFQHYYSQGGQAAPFERQALIKLRWVAGEETLGRQIEAYRDDFVYSSAPFDLHAAIELRQRQIRELVRPGSTDTKYGPGGLIDLEYTMQYLQLLHGASTPAVRTPNTLIAMQALHDAGHLSQQEYEALRQAYVFLRHLIDALRIVRGHARDLVLPPTDSEEFIFLARRMGYWGEQNSPARLATDIAHHMRQAAHIYNTRFATPAAYPGGRSAPGNGPTSGL